MDALVVPTHGEGWGRPQFEVSSFALPLPSPGSRGDAQLPRPPQPQAHCVPLSPLLLSSPKPWLPWPRRPQAMAMGVPVISTNWSGLTAFMDDKVAYPIRVEAIVEVDDKSPDAFV